MNPDDARSALDREVVQGRLAAQRAGAIGRIAGLTHDFAEIVEANSLVAVDDEHDPDGASTAFERAHVAALLAQAQDQVVEVARALDRLEQGSYGRCEDCGEPIPAERLEVRPAAITCVACAVIRSTKGPPSARRHPARSPEKPDRMDRPAHGAHSVRGSQSSRAREL